MASYELPWEWWGFTSWHISIPRQTANRSGRCLLHTAGRRVRGLISSASIKRHVSSDRLNSLAWLYWSVIRFCNFIFQLSNLIRQTNGELPPLFRDLLQLVLTTNNRTYQCQRLQQSSVSGSWLVIYWQGRFIVIIANATDTWTGNILMNNNTVDYLLALECQLQSRYCVEIIFPPWVCTASKWVLQ